jgi:hypothetical protein
MSIQKRYLKIERLWQTFPLSRLLTLDAVATPQVQQKEPTKKPRRLAWFFVELPQQFRTFII